MGESLKANARHLNKAKKKKRMQHLNKAKTKKSSCAKRLTESTKNDGGPVEETEPPKNPV
jgi:hypothetical protein